MRNRLHLFLIIPLLLSACDSFDPQAYVPGLDSPFPTPSSTAAEPFATIPVTATSTPVSEPMIVCTNIPEGNLNVRAAPSDRSAIHGHIAEGVAVMISGRREQMEESIWIELSHPIEGWVNARYLCKK